MSGRITVAGARYMTSQLFGPPLDPLGVFHLAMVRSVSPTVFNVADELDEPEDESYVRAEIQNTAGKWASVSTYRTNTEDIVFDAASVDWGLIKHWALCTESTGGDVLAFGRLSSVVDIRALDRAVVPVGSLAIGMNVLYQET